METYTLAPNLNNAQNYFIFNNSPFYLSSLRVSIVASAKSFSSIALEEESILEIGVDYQPAFNYNQATALLGEAVYGGIVFTDPKLAGLLKIILTPIGGYTSTTAQRSTVYTNPNTRPLTDRWEDVFSTIPPFETPDVLYSVNPRNDITDVVASISEIAAQLGMIDTNNTVFDFTRHTGDLDNPHGDTSVTIGLGQVPNWNIASVAEIISGNIAHRFVTPAGVYGAILGLIHAATPSLAGRVALNLGSTSNDDYNGVDVLTAGGLLSMLRSGLMDDVLNRLETPRPVGQFFPFPVVYPAVYNRKFLYNFKELVLEVEKIVGVSPLTYSAATGTVYFPNGVTVPSMSLQRRSTVRSPVNKPLFY